MQFDFKVTFMQGRRNWVCRVCSCTPTFWLIPLIMIKFYRRKNRLYIINCATRFQCFPPAPCLFIKKSVAKCWFLPRINVSSLYFLFIRIFVSVHFYQSKKVWIINHFWDNLCQNLTSYFRLHVCMSLRKYMCLCHTSALHHVCGSRRAGITLWIINDPSGSPLKEAECLHTIALAILINCTH